MMMRSPATSTAPSSESLLSATTSSTLWHYYLQSAYLKLLPEFSLLPTSSSDNDTQHQVRNSFYEISSSSSLFGQEDLDLEFERDVIREAERERTRLETHQQELASYMHFKRNNHNKHFLT
jgi:hypothetical protein